MQSNKPYPLSDSADSEASEASESSSVASKSKRTGRNKPRRGLLRAHFVQAGRQRDKSPLAGKLKGKNRDMQEKNTQLVLAGLPTGWTAMANAVRNFDEEKVKECKEDVDTLLVFAGLFSAVLTAFLIESYSNLVEDPATQTLAAIRQLVAQTSGYTLKAGMLNSSAPPLIVEAFQAPSIDIRVNVLWFASLMFSLITASFGILVKQWLREFLAAENPSPQARLRVRHLRYPQLSHWKVFEIAAILPSLLQLALALFFVGLCYFTASVHPSVKYTTLPLVIGWTFCFSTVTILPLFCPQCPYRTALLKAGVRTVHRWIGNIAKTVVTSYHTTISQSVTVPPSYRLKERLLAGVVRLSKRLSVFLGDNDEIRVMRRADKDVEILGTVDSIQSDDELLGTAIAEALDYLNCQPEQFETFLRTVLENRGYPLAPIAGVLQPRGPMSIDPFPVPLLDLRLVSRPTRNAICNVISHYATNVRLNRGPFGPHVWNTDQSAYRTVLMCMIMLAVSDCPCPKDGLYIIGSNFHFNGSSDRAQYL
ncbi:hypothetical protein BC629DRAFT_1699406 [Irpex lacteus]|nr:hypothetical protein BC629DRAFT_1699406 [Irpex lacteus]